jgi:hypothetical protein
MGIFSYVKLGKKIFGKQKTTGTEVINKVTPKVSTKLSKLKIETAKSKGKFKKTMDSISRDVSKTGAAFKKITQKLKGEKVTESGVSKGKDLRENKMGGGMMGRRFGYKGGSKDLVGKQKNIDVAAPFGKITGADFKKLRKK